MSMALAMAEQTSKNGLPSQDIIKTRKLQKLALKKPLNKTKKLFKGRDGGGTVTLDCKQINGRNKINFWQSGFN